MTRLIAIDPGKTTGIVVKDHPSGMLQIFEGDFNTSCHYIEAAMQGAVHDSVFVIIERFIITLHTAKNTQAPWSLEMIGAVRWAAKKILDIELTMSDQNAAKRLASNDRLKQMGYYTPGKGHANDAARHLLLFEANRGFLEPEVLRSLVGS